MKRLSLIALVAAWSLGFASASSFCQSADTEQTDTSVPVKVYQVGKDVTAPELRAMDFSSTIAEECEGAASGEAELSFIVDAAGHARNIMFVRPIGNELDKLVLVILGADRFKPGERNGTARAVGRSAKIKVDGCIQNVENEAGHRVKRIRLNSQPIKKIAAMQESPSEAVFAPTSKSKDPVTFKVGGKVHAPVPINQPQAEYTAEARKKGIIGACAMGVVVDAQGMPQEPRVIRSLEPGLDQKALEAVERYRFKPAVLNGEQPIPVIITIVVNFRGTY